VKIKAWKRRKSWKIKKKERNRIGIGLLIS
jgi:hypothetical protein